MIRQKNFRVRSESEGQLYQGEYEHSTIAKALENMVVAELGYGGIVTEISPARIVVETHISGCKDTAVFEGPTEEMEFIVRIAAHHAVLMSDETSRNAFIDKAVDFLDALPGEMGGTPLYISMVTPFLMGEPSAAVALFSAMGITDPDAVKTLAPISLKDLVAVVLLHLETGMPFFEIVREMGLTRFP